MQLVNKLTTETAPRGTIKQLGHLLLRIIHVFAEADEDAKVFMAKWNVKDGFLLLDCKEGEDYNFAYVLPQEEGLPIKLVIPVPLQMGWIESTLYFGAELETRRDVAEQYVEQLVGTLPVNKFAAHLAQGEDFGNMPEVSDDKRLKYLLEVFVDDFFVGYPHTAGADDACWECSDACDAQHVPSRHEQGEQPYLAKEASKAQGSMGLA